MRNKLNLIFLPKKIHLNTKDISGSEPGLNSIEGVNIPENSEVVIKEPNPEVKKKMAIPKYLMKLNDDFFASVSPE